jgi:Leucine-rich repeat (LRR) protein
MLNLVEKEEKI